MNYKSAIIWNSIEAFGSQFVSVITLFFLARLLTPEDFGIFGMIAIVSIISSVLIEGGIVGAIIYKTDISEKELSTLFYLNILISVFVILIIILSAESIAYFYREPRLASLLYVLTFSFLINSLGVIPYAILAKKMDFKLISKIKLAAQIISGLIAVIFALNGFGFWSLVVQIIISSLLNTLFLFLFVKWKPLFVFSLRESILSIKYGSNLVFASLLNAVFDNLYYVVIGKIYSPIDLGYYYQANKIQTISSHKLKNIIQQSTFPIFSRISDNIEETRKLFFESLNNSMFINIFLMGAIFITSQDFIPILLGTKWLPSVYFIKILCVSSIFLPFFSLTRNVLLSQGKSNQNFFLEVISKIVLLIIIYFSINKGLEILVASQIVFSIIVFIICSIFNSKSLNLEFYYLMKVFLITMIVFGISIFLSNSLIDLFEFKGLLRGSLLLLSYTIIYLVLSISFNPVNFFTKKIQFLKIFNS